VSTVGTSAVAGHTEPEVDRLAGAVDRAVEVAPGTTNPDEGLILLAKSPDWPEAERMREDLFVSWRQCGRKQDLRPA
jgi:hypothetical protein